MPAKDLIQHIISVREGELTKHQETIGSYKDLIVQEEEKVKDKGSELDELSDLYDKIWGDE